MEKQLNYLRTEIYKTNKAAFYFKIIFIDEEGKLWYTQMAQFWYELEPYTSSQPYTLYSEKEK